MIDGLFFIFGLFEEKDNKKIYIMENNFCNGKEDFILCLIWFGIIVIIYVFFFYNCKVICGY